jgi:hypothetical protein
METLNQTRFVSQFTMGMDKTGREYLSLVVKGTFDFPASAAAMPLPSATQRPLVMADEFTGPPGFSAARWETDFAFRKPHAEVMLQGAAYAEGGRAAERVRVGLLVGRWSKQFDVVGPREWRVAGPVITATRPYPFERLDFGYDTAFGGVDRSVPDNPAPDAYALNPHGLGFATVSGQSRLTGLPLPLTEDPRDPVASPYGKHVPMAFGPVFRAHPDRVRWGGTYDQNWADNIFPFLPADFDDRYFQSTLPDQWTEPFEPFTPVVIRNLTPLGREEFRLPDTILPIKVFRGRETCLDTNARPDTLIFDTEARQVMLVWRVAVPMRKIITEFTEAWIGRPTPAMLRARATGKRYVRAVLTERDREDEEA